MPLRLVRAECSNGFSYSLAQLLGQCLSGTPRSNPPTSIDGEYPASSCCVHSGSKPERQPLIVPRLIETALAVKTERFPPYGLPPITARRYALLTASL